MSSHNTPRLQSPSSSNEKRRPPGHPQTGAVSHPQSTGRPQASLNPEMIDKSNLLSLESLTLTPRMPSPSRSRIQQVPAMMPTSSNDNRMLQQRSVINTAPLLSTNWSTSNFAIPKNADQAQGNW